MDILISIWEALIYTSPDVEMAFAPAALAAVQLAMGIGNAISDYFVICTGASDTQVDAISESIEKEVLIGAEEKPWHREGFQNKEWILLDYVNVVVHVFKNNVRSFYGLEELWGDAAITHIENP